MVAPTQAFAQERTTPRTPKEPGEAAPEKPKKSKKDKEGQIDTGALAKELGVSKEAIELAMSVGLTEDQLREQFGKTAPKTPADKPEAEPGPKKPKGTELPPTQAPFRTTPVNIFQRIREQKETRQERVKSILRGE